MAEKTKLSEIEKQSKSNESEVEEKVKQPEATPGEVKEERATEAVEEEVAEAFAQKEPDTEKPKVEAAPENETESEKKEAPVTEATLDSGSETEAGEESEEKAEATVKVDEKETEQTTPRKFQFPFLKKKQGAEEKEDKEDKEAKEKEKETQPITPQEAINVVDKKNRVSEDEKIVEIAERIDETIESAEEKDEYWVIRVRKKMLLLIVGIGVLLMWMLPLSRGAQGVWGGLLERIRSGDRASEEVSATPLPSAVASESGLLKVRIRAGSVDQVKAAEVAERVKLAETVGYVEVVDEGAVRYSTVEVITRPENSQLYESLREVLGDEYQVASSEAALENESDIDVLIQFGEGN